MSDVRTDQVNVNVDINGKKAGESLNDLRRQARELSKEFNAMASGSADAKAKMEQLQGVNAKIKSIQDEVRGVGGAFSGITKEIKAFGVVALAALGGQMLLNGVNNLIEKNAELSDSLSDIQKTTGLTSEEVKELNDELGKINTRTSTKELREIAIIAGQLGITGKKDILGFTSAIDKLVVALGDEFTGGAEQVAKEVGALRNVFSDIKSENLSEDLLHIGNALNVIGSSGAATAPVVSDFANRIGGVGIKLGLTTDQVLGLSATLQELNVNTERGGTAMTQILLKMSSDTEAFAKIAGVPIDEFTHKVNTDLFGAFKLVVEGTNKTGTSATNLAAIMKNLGVDGAGASEVFAKLGSNTQLLESKVTLAGDALKGTGSIMNEFATKNENFAAKIEKLGKSITAFFSGGFLNEFLVGAVDGLNSLLGKSEDITDSFFHQKEVVEDLEKNVKPLISRYDELRGKTVLNKSEQNELNTIIEQLSKSVPTAVSEWDKYGKALSINTNEARAFIEQQKAIKEELNRDAIGKEERKLKSLENQIAGTTSALNRGTKVQADSRGLFAKEVALTSDEIRALANELSELQRRKSGVIGIINDLKGISNIPKSVAAPTVTKGDGALIISDEEAKKEKKRIDDLARHIADFYHDVDDLDDKSLQKTLDGINKELAAVDYKYDKLKERGLDLLANSRINEEQRLNVLANLATVEVDRQKEKNEVIKKYEEDLNRDILAIRNRLNDAKLAADAKELADINARYKDIEAKAAGNAEKLKEIEELKQSEIDAAILKHKKLKLDTEAEIEKQLLERRITDDQRQEASINSFYDGLVVKAEKNSDEIVKINKQRDDEIAAYRQAKNEETERQIREAIIAQTQLLSDTVFQIREMASKRELDNQLQTLNAQRNNELNNTNLTESERKSINDKYDEMERQAKTDAWKKQQKAAINQAIINGALAITNILATMPWVDFGVAHGIAIAAAVGSTAAQLSVIGAQEPPQFAEGGPTFSKGGHIQGATLGIIGEKGPEWVAPNWMMHDPASAGLIYSLEEYRQGKSRKFASGGPTTNTGDVQATTGENSAEVNKQLLFAVNRLIEVLSQPIKADAELSFNKLEKAKAEVDTIRDYAKVA